MQHHLPRTDAIYAFSSEHKSVLTVDSGDTVKIDTYDCFSNQLKRTEEFDSLDWSTVNPATGPIFINTAEAGDILQVRIDKIELAEEGVMASGPGLGTLGDRLTEYKAKAIPIKDGKAIFSDDYILPLNPMVGVIGVAPAGEPIPTGTPDSHGGNMDNKMVTEGATLYFPVAAKGALFALGDLHAVMGDGEIGVTGLEIPGTVTVTFHVIKGHHLTSPMLENDTHITTIFSALTLDEAVKSSVHQMFDFLLAKTQLQENDLTMLMSAACQTEICQIVDPLVTARCVISKEQFKIGELFK